MKENMRLSIIIPVYNAEKYIKNCLDSLLRQNVGGIEILCIDDGSTDFTAKIIKTYVEKYPFINNFLKLSNKNIDFKAYLRVLNY